MCRVSRVIPYLLRSHRRELKRVIRRRSARFLYRQYPRVGSLHPRGLTAYVSVAHLALVSRCRYPMSHPMPAATPRSLLLLARDIRPMPHLKQHDLVIHTRLGSCFHRLPRLRLQHYYRPERQDRQTLSRGPRQPTTTIKAT